MILFEAPRGKRKGGKRLRKKETHFEKPVTQKKERASTIVLGDIGARRSLKEKSKGSE